MWVLIAWLHIPWRILVCFRGFCFWRLYFCMVEYLSFHNSLFCLKVLFNVNGKAIVWHTTCYVCMLCTLPNLEKKNLSKVQCTWMVFRVGISLTSWRFSFLILVIFTKNLKSVLFLRLGLNFICYAHARPQACMMRVLTPKLKWIFFLKKSLERKWYAYKTHKKNKINSKKMICLKNENTKKKKTK